MGEIAGKVLGILATVAVFTLIIAGMLWPAMQEKGTNVEQQIQSTNIGGEGS